MPSNEDLDKAVAQNIISAAQADKLRQLSEQPVEADAPIAPDEERFRILGGFNDIFVTIGLFLLIGAIYGFAESYGSNEKFLGLSAVIAWGLSEVFARRLKLALPSIVLALMFSISVFSALFAYVYMNYMEPQDWFLLTLSDANRQHLTLISLASALAAALHLWRFRVPIDGALIAVFLIGALFGVISMLFDIHASNSHLYIFFLSGLAVFATAMRLDISDRLRTTRRADIAFWLHLLAAPLLIHPIAELSFGDLANIGLAQAFVIMVAFAALALFALIIDRRAILVSALIYVGIALGFLVEHSVSTSSTLPVTLLILALIVLSLSAGWHNLRARIVNALPRGRLVELIPPVI